MRRWFVIHAKPGCEAVAHEHLERQGYGVYYPRLLSRAQRRGRWVERIVPLFPRYLFLELDVGSKAIAPIHSTVGVAGIVRFGLDYAVVPTTVIDNLRARADASTGLHRLVCDRPFRAGQALRIVAGVFDGLEGIFQRASAEERVVVMLKLLGQETSVQIPADFVEPVSWQVSHALG